MGQVRGKKRHKQLRQRQQQQQQHVMMTRVACPDQYLMWVWSWSNGQPTGCSSRSCTQPVFALLSTNCCMSRSDPRFDVQVLHPAWHHLVGAQCALIAMYAAAAAAAVAAAIAVAGVGIQHEIRTSSGASFRRGEDELINRRCTTSSSCCSSCSRHSL
jgi:hypothetical protein